MKKLRLSLGLFLTVALVVTTFTGCAAAPQATETPAKKDVTLAIAVLADATGPYAVTVGPQLNAMKDFGKWVNETNYIPGVKLDVKAYDHGLKMEQCVALYKEAVTTTPAPILTNGGLWSSAAATLAGFAKQNKIPIIDTTPLKEVVIPPGWFFGYQPAYEGQVGAYIDWIVDNWKADSKIPWIKKHYQNRKPRLALMSWDITLGRANESAEVKCYAASRGVDWAGAEYVPMTVGDVTPQLTRLKDKTDFIYVGMFGSAWQAVLKKAAEMGIRDQFMDVGPAYFSPIEIAKFVPELANNNGAVQIFVAGYDDLPRFIQQNHDALGYPRDFMSYAAGYTMGDLMAEAIRKTVDKVGANKVTGPAIYEAICAGAITNFTPMSLRVPVTFSNNEKLVKMDGADAVIVSVIQGWDASKGPAEKSYISQEMKVPALLPGGKDVPPGCQ